MQLFVVLNGKKEGPISLYQLREMLREGGVDGSTYAWMRGQENWVPLREIPLAQSVIQEVERQRLDEELAKREKPAVPPVPEIPYQRLPSHGLARYGARMIDVLLAQLILIMLIGIPRPPEGFPDPSNYEEARQYLQRTLAGDLSAAERSYLESVALIQFGALVGFWMVEACLLAMFGATPGKWLFRLRVEDHRGKRPGFFRALGRSVLVFWLGMGGRIPLLEWLASFLSFLRLQNRGITGWDQQMCTQVRQERVSRWRVMAILIAFVAIAALAFLLPA